MKESTVTKVGGKKVHKRGRKGKEENLPKKKGMGIKLTEKRVGT